MAEYIDFEAGASDSSGGIGSSSEDENDDAMIDDAIDVSNNDASFFRFCNQTSDSSKILSEISAEQEEAALNLEVSNYQQDGDENNDLEIDETASKVELTKFENYLKNPVKEQTKLNSFMSALLFGINYQKNKDLDYRSVDELKEKIGLGLYEALNSEVERCILDLDKVNFDNMCLTINDIFIEKGSIFLRLYEKKQKFRHIFHKTEEKNKTTKTLSSCIQIKFNGFNVAAPYLEKMKKQDLFPIDIVYEPVKTPNEIIKCYFVTDIRFAYFGKIPKDDKIITNRPYECYYCQKFFAVKRTFDRHIKFCSGKPGIVYNFDIQNIVTFEGNIKYQGDVPFAIYADFETTTPNCDFVSPENESMFSISYAIVIAWHPKLNLPRQFVVRGYNHSLEELTDVTYLTDEQLSLRKQITTEQLKRCSDCCK